MNTYNLKDAIINYQKIKGNSNTKKQDILNVAIDLFSLKGYNATATSEIAKLANVSEGTLFNYFKNKQNLLLEIIIPVIIQDAIPEIARDISNNILKRDYISFSEFIKLYVNNRFEFVKLNWKILKVLYTELLYQNDMKTEFFNIFMKEQNDKFCIIFEKFKDNGEICDINNELILRIILSNFVGFVVTRFIIFPEKEWNDSIELQNVCSIIIKALSKNNSAKL